MQETETRKRGLSGPGPVSDGLEMLFAREGEELVGRQSTARRAAGSRLYQRIS